MRKLPTVGHSSTSGELTVSPGQYNFTGAISAKPDPYDFDPQPGWALSVVPIHEVAKMAILLSQSLSIFSERSGLYVISNNPSDRQVLKFRFWPSGYKAYPPSDPRFLQQHASFTEQKATYDVSQKGTDQSERLYRICVGILRSRKSDIGRISRKVAQQELDRKLKFSVPTRVFNQAYQTVFQSKRGRPRNGETTTR